MRFSLATALGQDAAPTSLDFGPEEEPALTKDTAALAQARAASVYGRRVRYVRVEGRWADRVPLPLVAGDILTSEKLSAAMNALRAAITAPSGPGLALRSKGEVGVFYISPEFDTAPAADANGNVRTGDRTVGVILRPDDVHISLVEIGNNVLPIPRSSWPTFYDYAPRWLLALNPTGGVSYDRAFGTAMSLGVATDLLSSDRQHFDLRADGTKSLEESFYRANGGFRYSIIRNDDVLREMSLSADFDGAEEPLGANDHTHYSGRAALGVKLKLAPNVRLSLNAGYRRTDDRLTNPVSTLDAEANEQTSRLLFDAIPSGVYGFFRAAVWEENAWQTTGDSYQRVVGRAGYEKEVSVAPNQTVGVELLAGAGHASGGTPGFARFFGGNAPGQFLYDGSDAASLTSLPSGPIIRSFGENQARLAGGDRLTSGGNTFWHVNLNVTIPIRPWSMSLIPNEMIDLGDEQVSLKRVLKNQINVTGLSMLTAVLRNEGASNPEARARKILREVTPATSFIIDDANVYSLKPLLMFDAAGLSDGNGRSETWLAAGGGLQLTIVTAKFEAGYMHTLSGPRQGHGGNAFVRLVFENLF